MRYFNGGILSASVNHTTWYSPLMEMHNVVVCVWVFVCVFVRSVVGGVSVGDLLRFAFCLLLLTATYSRHAPRCSGGLWVLSDVCNNDCERLKSLTGGGDGEPTHSRGGGDFWDHSFDRSTPCPHFSCQTRKHRTFISDHHFDWYWHALTGQTFNLVREV